MGETGGCAAYRHERDAPGHRSRAGAGPSRPEKSSRKEEEAARERPVCRQHGCKCCGEQRGHRRAQRESESEE